MENTKWVELINERKEGIAENIVEAWKDMLTEDNVCTSMRSGVLLWEDGDITKFYRDQNSFSEGEHNGTAICIYSTGSTYDECRSEFDNDQDYIDCMLSEYTPDIDDIIGQAIKELR